MSRTYTNFNLYVGNRPTLDQCDAVAAKFGLDEDTSKSKVINAILDPALVALLEAEPTDGEVEITVKVRIAA